MRNGEGNKKESNTKWKLNRERNLQVRQDTSLVSQDIFMVYHETTRHGLVTHVE